jgi:hypothetical protein
MFWRKSAFQTSKDADLLLKVDRALNRDQFFEENDCMSRVSSVLKTFGGWAEGCECHEPERKAGISVDCGRRGQRAPQLQKRVEVLIADLMEHSQAVPARWPFYSDALCCYRVVCSNLSDRFSFLDQLPYLLIRMRDRSVAKQCLELYDATDVKRHHRLTNRLLSRSGGLRHHFEAARSILCHAIALPGRKSALRAGFWPACYRESTEIGFPAGQRGRPEGRFWCSPGSRLAKIRPGRPIYGTEAVLRDIE